MLYKNILTFDSVSEILKLITQMKVTEQYFPAVMLNILYKVVPTILIVEETLR